MLKLYSYIMSKTAFALRALLNHRVKNGKEDPSRLGERMGIASMPRPNGRVIWFHAASVGEAQSTLILVDNLLRLYPDAHILVTTGTVTSAALMAARLPERALHHFYPLDHPLWVARFLDHWQPDIVLWLESEIWPNMLHAISQRNIPAVLINARLSPRSLRRWQYVRRDIADLLSVFNICLAQTEEDAASFKALGVRNVIVSGNLKYSAQALPIDNSDLAALKDAIKERPVWVLASTHDPEEDIACRIHKQLKTAHPALLTIIVPRHPQRRDEIMAACGGYDLSIVKRGDHKALPDQDTDIYIADTIGELGLFYKLAPIAFIGRSLSNDGGGGHNPIEAAQYGCAVLYGKNVQNLQAIYDELHAAGGAVVAADEHELCRIMAELLQESAMLKQQQERARRFVEGKADILRMVLAEIKSLFPALDSKSVDDGYNKDTACG